MKRITLSALLMTLFLLIGCNNGGVKEDMATTSDGSVIDLKKVSQKINDAVDFAASVKEVRILVKSIDKLAKAIGQKIKNDGGLDADGGQNGSLISGAYNIVLFADTKLGQLENKEGISEELKKKVTAAKQKSTAFLTKLKEGHATLGKKEASDEDAKKAIDITDATKDKGASELVALNTAIGALVEAADAAVKSAITALTPAKAATSKDK
ncbi:outer surface protein C (plasmid) [Candidatus Borrelia fainii]|uniref:Outer surface protein C n=1 Tax=Candidatus Borrelia fainii TaxID=2518322 RepID=A0ABN6USR3_9SPIR|nr:Vsp/OspC family lipoprotein [Candidatus Borrelia fainii]BDU63436.1 outer surface protein C [Candidatus Borrelia fainii]